MESALAVLLASLASCVIATPLPEPNTPFASGPSAPSAPSGPSALSQPSAPSGLQASPSYMNGWQSAPSSYDSPEPQATNLRDNEEADLFNFIMMQQDPESAVQPLYRYPSDPVQYSEDDILPDPFAYGGYGTLGSGYSGTGDAYGSYDGEDPFAFSAGALGVDDEYPLELANVAGPVNAWNQQKKSEQSKHLATVSRIDAALRAKADPLLDEIDSLKSSKTLKTTSTTTTTTTTAPVTKAATPRAAAARRVGAGTRGSMAEVPLYRPSSRHLSPAVTQGQLQLAPHQRQQRGGARISPAPTESAYDTIKRFLVMEDALRKVGTV